MIGLTAGGGDALVDRVEESLIGAQAVHVGPVSRKTGNG